MQEYVAGFAFDYDLDEVLLVRKQRPQWQAGKLNAIGGKIEPGEWPIDAMRREFTEETTLYVMDWESFCVLRGDGFVVHFFVATKPCSYLQGFKSPDEPIEIHNSHLLRGPGVLPNLEWLVPMAKAKVRKLDKAVLFEINEQYQTEGYHAYRNNRR